MADGSGPRIGILGAGFIARWHAAGLALSPVPCRRAGVHDPDPERATAFGADTGWPVVESEQALIEASDAVFVCTWTSAHPRLVEAVAGAGCGVFCEKPLATDLTGARAVARAVREAGVVNQVGLVLRYSPAFAALRGAIRHPDAGRVMSIVFRDDQYLPVGGAYASTWRTDRSRAGSGTLLEHSIHDLDLIDHLAGPVTEVSARTASFHGHPGIEDLAVATLQLAGGGTATLTSVWHDVLSRPSLRRVEVLCERRFAVLEHDWFGPVRITHPDGREDVLAGEDLVAAARPELPSTGTPDGDFVTAVATRGRAWPDVGLALRAHELVDACYRSAAAGGVPVPAAPQAQT